MSDKPISNDEEQSSIAPPSPDSNDNQQQGDAVYQSAKTMPEKNFLKTISEDDEHLRVANYIALFGGRDLTGYVYGPNPDGSKGEFFSPETKFASDYTKTGILYVDWEHGLAPDDEPQRDDILGYVDWSTAKTDTNGLWVERVLDRRNRYMQFLEPLIKEGKIGNSTEAVASGIQRAPDGHILSWPLKRDTLTVTPMEPRMLLDNPVLLKSISGLAQFNPAFKSWLPKDAGEASEPKEETPLKPEADTLPQKSHSNPETSIMEQQETTGTQPNTYSEEQVTDLLKSAVNAALEQYSEKLDAAKKPSVVVVEDEADKKAAKPWKSFGEFLYAVKAANSPGGSLDPRLRTKASGLSEGVSADGGFLVQTDFANELLKRTYEMGAITSRVRTYPISPGANALTINAIDETSRADGSRWGGIQAYWLSEAGEKTSSKPKFRQMELKLKKLIGLCYATDELLADTVALAAIIQDGFAEEFSFKVEDSIINGDGSGKPLGIMNSPALVTVDPETGQAADTITFMNIVKMWSRMWGRSRRNAVWLINQDIEPQLYSLNDPNANQMVFMPPGGLSAAPYATLFGRPVIPVEYAASLGNKGDIILADFSQYLMINKGGLETATSIHVMFVYDETAFRFVLRTYGEPGWNAPLTPYKGSNTLSPFVVLADRA